MSLRRRARAVVLQCLYEDDLNPRHNLAVSDRFVARRLHANDSLVAFARELLAGVRRHRPELDQRLTQFVAHWSLERLAVTDRNILRLGAYELLYTDTPPRVVINEAIELAKRFGADQSGQFVNGILDRLWRERQAAVTAAPPVAASPAPPRSTE